MQINRCSIDGANVIDPNESYPINTRDNKISNTEINYFVYNSKNRNTIDFIPISIFDTFTNLQVLFINNNQNFKTLKPQYLKNATKLTLFIVQKNIISNLDKNLFVEAGNLEYISFALNKIKSIHKRTFSGLQNLQVLRLNENIIKNIHFETFSHLIKLKILNLSKNQCIDQKFSNLNNTFTDIETVIRNNCAYYLDPIQFFKTVELLDTKILKISKENIEACEYSRFDSIRESVADSKFDSI